MVAAETSHVAKYSSADTGTNEYTQNCINLLVRELSQDSAMTGRRKVLEEM
jgi:hypothetical protein